MPGIDHLIRTDFKAVDKRDELRTVMGWLTGDTPKRPIVTDEGRPVGVINERSLMRRRLDPRSKVDNHTQATTALSAQAPLDDAVRRMLEFRAAYLPVENDGKPAGYIRALDVARELEARPDAIASCVKVAHLKEASTVGDALHAFAQEYVDVLPVVDAYGRCEGVIRRGQVLQAESGARVKGRLDGGGESIDPLQIPVGGMMDTAVATVTGHAAHAHVCEVLDRHGYAVVTDAQGRYLGLVTPATLLDRAMRGEGTVELPAPPGSTRVPSRFRQRRS